MLASTVLERAINDLINCLFGGQIFPSGPAPFPFLPSLLLSFLEHDVLRLAGMNFYFLSF